MREKLKKLQEWIGHSLWRFAGFLIGIAILCYVGWFFGEHVVTLLDWNMSVLRSTTRSVFGRSGGSTIELGLRTWGADRIMAVFEAGFVGRLFLAIFRLGFRKLFGLLGWTATSAPAPTPVTTTAALPAPAHPVVTPQPTPSPQRDRPLVPGQAPAVPYTPPLTRPKRPRDIV